MSRSWPQPLGESVWDLLRLGMTKADGAGADIPVNLERLARLIRAAEFGAGLNPAQWEAIRYLRRANRFSNSPGALARFAGATKGTISQTVKSLLAKGYVGKQERAGQKRSVSLILTDEGVALLENDPWERFAVACADLGAKTRRRMAKGLAELLARELQSRGSPTFGTCPSCRFYRADSETRWCMYFDEALTTTDITRICVAHLPRG
ncbi:MarR family transcriptional regulator [soil metagenome]